MKTLVITICAVILFTSTLISQVTADLTIQNQQAVGTDFFFDIYITRTGTNDVFLGTADFVLTFNAIAFTNPAVTREASSFWNLTSTSSNSVGSTYRLATTPAGITSNEIIINLNQVSFGDQSEFDDIVARINNVTNTHRVGRYKVSGINNPTAFMNLQWKTTGTGVTTQVFTFAPVSPWNSSPVTINAINPPDAQLPVELSLFIAKVRAEEVDIIWETKTEINNYGFDIERSLSADTENRVWQLIGFVNGYGNSNSDKKYTFTDKNPYGGSNFVYRLKQIDNDGQFKYSDEVEVELLPTEYNLYQNYPNPFNPMTNIKFSLPEDTRVSIKVFDMLGALVSEILNSDYKAGYHKIEFNADRFASGIYIYRLETKNFTSSKKMLLIK